MTAFRSRKNVVVSKDTTISDYQELVNQESKRKRDHFRKTVKLCADLNIIVDFKRSREIEFSISFTDEKGVVIDTIFAKGKMPLGLEDSRCYADLLKSAKIESQPLSGDRVRNYTAIRLESANQ